MKTYMLFTVHAVFAVILTMASCSHSKTAKLKGEWRSKNNQTTLKITDKQFTMNTDSPVPEDYFVKNDTIFTSFEGNLPYTKFIIKQADEHNLKLMFPDSAMVEFVK
ncbi:hypothetical protein BDD43_2352 [Mucilaginibacter gracilis]|uniref:Lipocalin-like protein n=1 Tax=Mucilaginibacter gracilis TaxID=423350 RepID=A0A495J0M9_9SPHI|nr:hypothetical protein [Mucilaginibacter gracilis]RKR82181.1 hypothetical protein BDD43_2352 [Mucilaginibacter gracilis]